MASLVDDLNFFEGAEKTINLWFVAAPENVATENFISGDQQRRHREPSLFPASDVVTPAAIAAAAAEKQEMFECPDAASRLGLDLRRVSRIFFEKILKSINCEILSYKQGLKMDAYILSESSLFVARSSVMLKTCGTTRLLEAVAPIVKLAVDFGFDAEDFNFSYSRKNYLHPELQRAPHGDIAGEFAFLDQIFPRGAGYCFGNLRGDSWFYYTSLGQNLRKQAPNLQILMTEIDPDVMLTFMDVKGKKPRDMPKLKGLHRLFPGLEMDEFLFEPHGYSLNGFFRKGEYITIHITPEPEFSYVSFETNLRVEHHAKHVRGVVEYFKPLKATVVRIVEKDDSDACENKVDLLTGYSTETRQSLDVVDLRIDYAFHHRSPPPPPPPPPH